MSNSSINATRDYQHHADKGDLTNPQQSAGFTTDPLLTPTTSSQMPHPMHSDPTPSDNPDMFDKSTRHMNDHYDPDKKLSKKKRNKKLGLGGITLPHSAQGLHAGGITFSEHEKAAHERAEHRDQAIGQRVEEYEEDDEDDNDEEDHEPTAQEYQQSHKQHSENRITGTEQGTKQPQPKSNQDVVNKMKDTSSNKDTSSQGEENEKGENPTLMARATGVLSSAQEKATGLATSVMDAAKNAPVVGSLLNRVGLGGGNAAGDKNKDNTKEVNAQAEKEEA